jgi:hypothetical protein
MSQVMTDAELDSLINQLDTVLLQYNHCPVHEVAGALLSRITLLMTMDPSVGKHMLKFVWEKLDEIEQANPGNMI